MTGPRRGARKGIAGWLFRDAERGGAWRIGPPIGDATRAEWMTEARHTVVTPPTASAAAASLDAASVATSLDAASAAAWFDHAAGRLHLARDPLGERPLYFSARHDRVAFASEIATVRTLTAEWGTGSHPELLPEAVDAYFAFGYVPAPWTIARGIQRVRAGHAATIALGEASTTDAGGNTPGRGIAEETTWSLPERDDLGATPEEMLAKLEETLDRRLPRHGPPVLFLSGGLDSGLVAALAASRGTKPVTLTVRFTDPRLDESERARALARRIGAEHHEIPLEDLTPDLFEEIVGQLDEPFADAAVIPTYVLARAASEHGATVLTGDGSDALLAGDHWFRRMRRLDRIARVPSALRAVVAAIAPLGGTREGRRLRELVRWSALRPSEAYLRMREKWTDRERSELYTRRFRTGLDARAAGRTYTEAPIAPFVWGPGRFVEGAIRLDMIHNLPEGLLMKVERMGRPHGVTCRSPFLDPAFVAWASRLDVRLLLGSGSGKRLLREAAGRVLPAEVARVRKQGLISPTGRWMAGPLRGVLDAAVAHDLVEAQGIFEAGALTSLARRFLAAPDDPRLAGRMWQVLVFQTWWRIQRAAV